MPGSIRGPESCCGAVRVLSSDNTERNLVPSEVRLLPADNPQEFIIEFEVGAILREFSLYSSVVRVEVYVDGRTPSELNGSTVAVNYCPVSRQRAMVC